MEFARTGPRQPSPQLRLAELVAALSLGIDLGFGQPMKHVLRQCLIALRLADMTGLDETARAHVYYTALLVNVGCHSDAHEQAKWFGDDLALKARKYDHALGSPAAAAAAMRRLGSGRPPLHRFRVGLEFALRPPFLIAHGTQDTLVPGARASALSARLQEVSPNPVVWIELPGAQHSFDLLRSVRFEALVDGIEVFAARSRD
jgi:acetyl esterase/lipase